MRSFGAEGSWISFEGSLKRVSIWLACSECGVTARRFVGRLLRGSALVGTDSRPGSDILVFDMIWELVFLEKVSWSSPPVDEVALRSLFRWSSACGGD